MNDNIVPDELARAERDLLLAKVEAAVVMGKALEKLARAQQGNIERAHRLLSSISRLDRSKQESAIGSLVDLLACLVADARVPSKYPWPTVEKETGERKTNGQ